MLFSDYGRSIYYYVLLDPILIFLRLIIPVKRKKLRTFYYMFYRNGYILTAKIIFSIYLSYLIFVLFFLSSGVVLVKNIISIISPLIILNVIRNIHAFGAIREHLRHTKFNHEIINKLESKVGTLDINEVIPVLNKIATYNTVLISTASARNNLRILRLVEEFLAEDKRIIENLKEVYISIALSKSFDVFVLLRPKYAKLLKSHMKSIFEKLNLKYGNAN